MIRLRRPKGVFLLVVILAVVTCVVIGWGMPRFGSAITGPLDTIPQFPAIVLAVCVALALAWFLWMVANPGVGLASMVLVIPLQQSVFGYPALVISLLPVIALGVCYFLSVAAKGAKIVLGSSLPQVLAVTVFGYSLFSLVLHINDEQGVLSLEQSLGALLMFLVVPIILRDRIRVSRAVYYLAGAAALVSILGLLQKISPYDFNAYLCGYFCHGQGILESAQVSRINSVFYDTNHMANFLVTSLLICTPFILARKPGVRRPVLVFVGLSLVLAAIFFSFSVSNWIALGIGVLIVWLFSSGKVKTRIAVVILAVGLIVLLLSAYGVVGSSMLPESFRAKFAALTGASHGLGELEQGPLGSRAVLIRLGLEVFGRNPLFGMGPGSYSVLVGASLGGGAPHSHNSYVLILAELGIVGMLLLGLVIASVVVIGIRGIRATEDRSLRYLLIGALSAIFANLVFLFSYDLIMNDLSFWFAMGLTLAASRLALGRTRVVH